MRDEGVIYVAGHPLLNMRCTRLPGCFYFPKCKLQVLLKARYSLNVLKVPLNSNKSINFVRFICLVLNAVVYIHTYISCKHTL